MVQSQLAGTKSEDRLGVCLVMTKHYFGHLIETMSPNRMAETEGEN